MGDWFDRTDRAFGERPFWTATKIGFWALLVLVALSVARTWLAYGTELGDAPSDEGTWGNSNPYVFFWTTNGQYIQWSGEYIYSDQPFRLKIEPLVVLSAGGPVEP